MRFVDEYRAPEQVMQLIEHLRERASHLSYTAERPLRIMEVCGGHTHAIFKFGLDQLLPENVVQGATGGAARFVCLLSPCGDHLHQYAIQRIPDDQPGLFNDASAV